MQRTVNTEFNYFTVPFLEDEFPYEINQNLKQINCELAGADSQTKVGSDTTQWTLFIKYDPNTLVHELHEALTESFQDGDIRIIEQIDNFWGRKNFCAIKLVHKS